MPYLNLKTYFVEAVEKGALEKYLFHTDTVANELYCTMPQSLATTDLFIEKQAKKGTKWENNFL